jgi:colanic acid/amylovoran biosynthesis glycosyltransferase
MPSNSTRDPDRPLRLAYLVARFPKTSETFVVRELNRVAAHPHIEARLLSLFPPLANWDLVHPSAESWMSRVFRPTWVESLRASLRFLRVRPLRMLSTAAILCWGFRRKPALAAKSLASMLIACAHAENLKADHVEHVHAHFLGNTATAAWVIWRLTGIRYSVTAHAYDLFVDQDFLVRKARDAAFVVAISQYNADFISHLSDTRLAPAAVIHAGVDVSAFAFSERRALNGGPVRALTVGSLIPRKGHRVLVEALAGADPMLARVQLTIVGEGPERPALEELIRRHGLEKRIALLGAQPEDRVGELLREADLFVLPSKADANGSMEGIPVVLMEALASGVPTVATRMSGIPELIEDSVTGTLAEPDDVVSLRAAIIRTLDEHARAIEMTFEGRARVESAFDVDRSAEALLSRFLAVATDDSYAE